MSLEHHKRLKRRYVRYGRDESLTDRFSRWRSDNPIKWLDVDDDGNRLDEDGAIIPDVPEDGQGGSSSGSDGDGDGEDAA
jgi:hypothetical protein